MRFLKFELTKIFVLGLFVLWVYLLSIVEGKHVTKRGIIENINTGIKYAGQMMGINTAADVATLVAKAFAPQQSTPKFDSSFLFQTPDKLEDPDRDSGSSSSSTSIISSADVFGRFLKMIGFDAGKLGALAINAFLMIAQLLGNTLKKRQYSENIPKTEEEFSYEGQQEERSARGNMAEDRPIDWILENPPKGLSHFIEKITDEKLPHKLLDAVSEIENKNGQGECIKLLMCKSAPFIWGMQKAVSKRLNANTDSSALSSEELNNKQPISSLFLNLPNIEEYRRHDLICEQRFSQYCRRSNT